MRIVVGGVSGSFGRLLVPALVKHGAKLILIDFDKNALKREFPNSIVGNYSDLSEIGHKADIFLNLTVLNETCSFPVDRDQIGVERPSLLELLSMSKELAITHFINVCSSCKLSKNFHGCFEEDKFLSKVIENSDKSVGLVNLYLPDIYGDHFCGIYKVFIHLPKRFMATALGVKSALKPIIHVDQLSDWVMHDALFARGEVILTTRQANNLLYLSIKRMIDILAALVGVIFCSFPMLMIWLLIALKQEGSVIFGQQRVGLNGVVFTCFKFRTMVLGTEQKATHEINRSAVTPVGKWLRRYKLDELPQLWNVLCGQMSLIGPRPCLPEQQELLLLRQSKGVLSVRPGVSGLAQLAGVDMSDPSRLLLWDNRYISLRGLSLDIRLIIQTFLGGGRGDRVE